MKRGWITWDPAELPPSTLQVRLENLKKHISKNDLAGLAVYTDVWKSNQARFLVNFMPYWNRSLLFIPLDLSPILICGLSPRVYPWIRSISTVEEIRPSGTLGLSLLQLCAEKKWTRIGVLDLRKLPYEIFASVQNGPVKIVDLPSEEALPAISDVGERTMRRHAIALARDILNQELATPVPVLDHRVAGSLERKFRRAGAEDLVILMTNGQGPPAPASGEILVDAFSVAIAMEYRGHWIRLARARSSLLSAETLRTRFESVARRFQAGSDSSIRVENLSGPYPYEEQKLSEVTHGSILSIDIEIPVNGRRLFYGDTCWYGESGVELL